MLRTAASEVNLKMLARYDQRNGDALKRLVAGGTSLVPYGRDILEAAEQVSFEIYEDHGAKDQDFRQVYEPWSRFRDDISRWDRINRLTLGQPSHA